MPRYNIGPTREYTSLYQLTSASWLYPISAWGEPVEIVLDPGVHLVKTPGNAFNYLEDSLDIGDSSCNSTSFVKLMALEGSEWRGIVNDASLAYPILSAHPATGTTFLYVRKFCQIKGVVAHCMGHNSILRTITTENVYSKVINCYLTTRTSYAFGGVFSGVYAMGGGSCYNVVVSNPAESFYFTDSNGAEGQFRAFNCLAVTNNGSGDPNFFFTSPSSNTYGPLLINCAVVTTNTYSPYVGFTSATFYHSACSNNSTSDPRFIPGTNGLLSVRRDDLGWVDFTDFHITSSAPWYNAGFNLSAYFIKDIDDEIIQTWCIGVDDPDSTNPSIGFSVDKTHIPLETGVRFQDESNLYPYFTSSTDHERIWEITNERTSASTRISTNNSYLDYLFTSGAIGGIQGDTIRVSLSAVYNYDGDVNDLDWF